MTDAFALLGEPRRPGVCLDALAARFRQFASENHPDRFHGQGAVARNAADTRYAELNAAYQTLREPRDRLLHLYELEAGSSPKDIQRIPPGTMDLFVEIGQACRDCDTHLTQQSGVTSPMLKLTAMQAGLGWTEKMLTLQQQVNVRRDALVAESEAMNPSWEAAPPPRRPSWPYWS